MTLEEAKKILKKEGFGFRKTSRPLTVFSKTFDRYESPEIVEAMHVLVKNKYNVTMESRLFHERKERLKKEFEANTTAPGGKNPALEESAKLFNDALLDEQAKKIKNLDELIASRNKIIAEQSEEIGGLKNRLHEKIEHLVEISKLSEERKSQLNKLKKVISKKNRMIKDKDAVLSDVSEELRLSKVREENLTSTCQKYLKEIEDLGKELAETKKMIGWVRNASKEYCDYGVDANNLIKELARLYVIACNDGSFDKAMLERCKNYQKYGFHTTCNRETIKEIDEIASRQEYMRPAPEEPCGEPKKSINTGDYISKEELMKIQEECVRKITTPPFSPISEMRKGNGIPDRMVVSADLGKGESYTSSVIVIPKDADPTLLRNIFKDMTDIINSEL